MFQFVKKYYLDILMIVSLTVIQITLFWILSIIGLSISWNFIFGIVGIISLSLSYYYQKRNENANKQFKDDVKIGMRGMVEIIKPKTALNRMADFLYACRNDKSRKEAISFISEIIEFCDEEFYSSVCGASIYKDVNKFRKDVDVVHLYLVNYAYEMRVNKMSGVFLEYFRCRLKDRFYIDHNISEKDLNGKKYIWEDIGGLGRILNFYKKTLKINVQEWFNMIETIEDICDEFINSTESLYESKIYEEKN